MTEPARRRLFAAWALLVWLGWLFSRELLGCRDLVPAFAGLLSPPWPAAGPAARRALLALGGAGLTALGGLGCGSRLLAVASPRPGAWLALAAGLPLLALAGQGLGWLGLADPRVLPVFAATAAVSAIAPLRRAAGRGAPRRTPETAPLPLVWLPRLAAAAVLAAACAPEVAWDAVVYHLRVPSLYLVGRRIVEIPGIFPSYFPFTGETLFMFARTVGGDPAARLLHAACWLAAGEGVGRLAERAWGAGPARAWGRAMFLTLPFGMVIASRAYVEFFLVLSLVGSLVALSGTRPRWLAAGWLAGAAFGTKYLGGATAVILFAVALRQARGPAAPARFASAACLAGGAWLVRNWLWTGNPVYPVIFGGPHWTPADMEGWRDDARALRPDPALLLTTPWRLMIEPGSDGALSPLVLAAAAGPLLWPAARGGRYWGVALSLLLVWWVTSPLARYLTPALAVACAAGAGCVNGIGGGPVTRRWMTRLSFLGLAGCVLCGIRAIQFSTASYTPALGKETTAEYRAGYFRPAGYTAVLEALERRVPPHGRAYLMGHVFSYDLPRRVWFEFLYVRPPVHWWVRNAAGADRVRVRARQAGLTHIAWHPLGGLAILGKRPWLSDWTPAGLRAYSAFWARHVRVAERIGDWVVFEIVPGRGVPWGGRTLPGTEAVTGPADIAWQAGRRDEAAGLARGAARRYPGFPDASRRVAEYGRRR